MATRLLIAKTGSAAAASTITNTTTASSPFVASGAAQLLIQHSRNTRIGQITSRSFSRTAPSAASAILLASRNRDHHHIMSKRAHSTAAPSGKMLTVENMNPNVVKMEYAVRGPLVIRAAEIEKELKAVSFYLTYGLNLFFG